MNIRSTVLAGAAAACLLAIGVSGAASAGTLYVQTTPAGAEALFGTATVLTFDSFADGVYANATEGPLTFTSSSGALHIDSDYNGSFNTFGGRSVHNCYCNDAFSELYFDFSIALEGFGFFWGASDTTWTLRAYDASNVLLETFVLPTTYGSSAGDFVAIYGTGIRSAVLSGDANDYVFVDNVTFGADYVGPGGGAVPEPATWAMMIIGFGAAGSMIRRRKALVA